MHLNKKKHELNETRSRVEQNRQEREARLAAMHRHGARHASNQKKHPRLRKVVWSSLAALLIIFVVAWALFSYGFVQSHLTAAILHHGDSQKRIGFHEYQYEYRYLHDLYNNYAKQGLAPANAEGQLDLDAKSGMKEPKEGSTWGEYLHYQTQEALKQSYAYTDAAEAMGLKLGEKELALVDQRIKQLQTRFPRQNDLVTYLEQNYGRGMTLDRLRKIFERDQLAAMYRQETPKQHEVSEQERETYYKEHQNTYDLFSYRLFTLSTPKAEDNATQEAIDKLKADTKAKAEELLERIKKADDLKTLAADYAPNDEQASYKSEDKTLFENRRLGTAGSTDIQDWLGDQSRKEGDKTLLESGSNFTVVVFLKREREERQTVNVRHILFEAQEGQASEEQRKAAEQKAKDLAAKIKSEDDMIRFSEELSQSGEAREAAEYKDVRVGQMVQAFNDWIYDEARKPGDVGVVMTNYGAHVIFFEGKGDLPNWAVQVTENIQNEAFEKKSKELLDGYQIDPNAFALRFIK